MSVLTNAPAFSSLDIQPIQFIVDVPSYRGETIIEAAKQFSVLGDDIQIEGAAWPDELGNNMYRITGKGGTYILKIKAVPDVERLKLSEGIYRFLDKKSPDVLIPLCTNKGEMYPLAGDGRVIECLPYIDGHHFQDEPQCLIKLGEALKRLHQVLEQMPLSRDVAASSEIWEQRLDKGRAALAEGTACSRNDDLNNWLDRNKDYLGRVQTGWLSLFDIPGERQPVHGDLNRGNVFFEKTSEKVWLLDFEDAPFAMMSRLMELAFVIQRFCLHDEAEPAVVSGRMDQIFEGYGELLPGLEMLPDLWRLWCYRSTVRIFCRVFENRLIFDSSELDKFVHLEQQAMRYASLVRNY